MHKSLHLSLPRPSSAEDQNIGEQFQQLEMSEDGQSFLESQTSLEVRRRRNWANPQPRLLQYSYLLGMIMCLVILFVIYIRYADGELKNFRSNRQKQSKGKFIYKNQSGSGNWTVINQKGQQLTLGYRKSHVLKNNQMDEGKLGNLQAKDMERVQKIMQQIKDPLQFGRVMLEGLTNLDNDIHFAEYKYMDAKYSISSHLPENNFCIVSPFRNLLTTPSSLPLYLLSLSLQNYSSFHVFMIDDMSTDNSTIHILKQIYEKYPRLSNRLTIIQNVDRIGALGNRDLVSRNLCEKTDIIMEIDADDTLISLQALKLYNKLYNSDEIEKQKWFVYSNYVMRKVGLRRASYHLKLGRNQQIDPEIHNSNTYRTAEKYWVTVHLRSYLQSLYSKIPLSYFIQAAATSQKKSDLKYYLWASDRFNMYPLVEMAGPSHTYFISQILYFYNLPDDEKRSQKGCLIPFIRYQSAISKTQTPLKKLEDLEEDAEMEEDYTVPGLIVDMMAESKELYEDCLETQKEE